MTHTLKIHTGNMNMKRCIIGAAGLLFVFILTEQAAAAGPANKTHRVKKTVAMSIASSSAPDVILGCPTSTSVTLNVLSFRSMDVFFEYGDRKSVV